MNDLPELLSKAAELAAASLAPSTRASYASDLRAFARFALSRGLVCLPAEAGTVSAWIAHASESLAPSSIVRSLVSIGRAHTLAGFPDPTKSDDVRAVRAGLLRLTRDRASNKATPIYFEDLKRMVAKTDCSMNGIRDAALLALGWACGARRSEIVALDTTDIEETQNGILVTFRQTKTGISRSVGIPVIPGIDLDFCARIQKWLARYGAPGPLFPSFGKLGRWFFAESRSRLQPRAVRDIVARYAHRAGLVGNYTGHSLRRGLISESARRGVPAWAIQRVTGHVTVDQLYDYIGPSRAFLDSPLNALRDEPEPCVSRQDRLLPSRE